MAMNTLLLVAELLSFYEVVGSESSLDFGHELGERSAAVSVADSEETLNSEGYNGEKQRPDDRHHETAFVNRTYETIRLILAISKEGESGRSVFSTLEVGHVTESEQVDADCDNAACDNHGETRLDAGETCGLFLGCTLGCGSICCCHCFE